jgi:FKBP-type peptidyl-prolyl cis-trans isomerase 2
MSTEQKQTINVGDNVTIHYRCTLEDGTLASDSQETGEPITFEVGQKTVLSGIDDRVVGMGVGDTKSFTLEPNEGYGEYDGTRIGHLPHSNFPAEFVPQLTEGMVIPLQSKDGAQRLIATVTEVGEETVTCDFNHPLAGKTLTFDVEVVTIDGATTTTTDTEETTGDE